MARTIPIIGTIKTTLNVIISAFLGFNLIRYLYNLILSTLGIDNPYLYEQNKEKTEKKEADKKWLKQL